MRRRIVTTQGDPEPEETDHQGDEVGAEHSGAKERGEDNHLHDEHGLAPEPIRQAAQADCADQDSAQAGGADEAVLGGGDIELAGDQRQCDAGHENDKALEEFAGGGQHPDAPLHRRSWGRSAAGCHPAR